MSVSYVPYYCSGKEEILSDKTEKISRSTYMKKLENESLYPDEVAKLKHTGGPCRKISFGV
jgi:hypothetical protein